MQLESFMIVNKWTSLNLPNFKVLTEFLWGLKVKVGVSGDIFKL